MQLINKIKAVNRLFNQLDSHNASFIRKSNLGCVPNCGACCSKTNIEVTILEFLPAAYNLYQSGEFNAVLSSIEKNTDKVCVFYSPSSKDGFCSNYKNRGLICRLFGFSARLDKYGNHVLVSCKQIKSGINTGQLQNTLKYAPEMASYYLKLFTVDPGLAIQYFPINQSIKKALDIVLLHFKYTKKPVKKNQL